MNTITRERRYRKPVLKEHRLERTEMLTNRQAQKLEAQGFLLVDQGEDSFYHQTRVYDIYCPVYVWETVTETR